MMAKQSTHRWEEQKHKVSDQEIIRVLKKGIPPDRIKGLNTYSIHGVEYFDLSGMTIEDEVLDVGNLAHIDLSHSRLKNVKFTSMTTLFNFRFESAELINVSFKPTNQNIDTRLVLENFLFKGAKIEKVDFSQNDFSGRNYFLNTTFNEVDFSGTSFKKSVFSDFSKSRFGKCNFKGANVDNTLLCGCFFIESDLRDASFRNTALSNIEFINCFVNSKTAFDERVILDKNRTFEKAFEVYTQLKNLFSSRGHFRESYKYHVRKMISLREKERNPFRKLSSWIYWLISGYGERPFRILYWMLLVIIAFALGYHFSQISYSGSAHGVVKNFYQCLYFSTVTFTTLGYGDWLPVDSVSKTLAGIEAFSGLVFMAIFSVLIAKKMSRE